jgi:beta-mannosidase
VDRLDLTGMWHAAPADDDLRRAFHDDAYDDRTWERIAVPGHWRSTPSFADQDGPLLYRRSFESPPPASGRDTGRRWWLELDGLFYQGDVWLDGTYLGDTEGYFVPHAFEVTDALAARHEHQLAVEVSCAPQTDRRAKRNITGVFQHWDCLDRDWNPGGIWRPVRLAESGPVRIARLRVLCLEATPERAVVSFGVTLDADTARRIELRTTVGGEEHREDRPVAAGANDVSWTVTVDQPRLWWPRALGEPALHDVTVEVCTAGDPEPSDRRTRRVGLRRIELRDWVASVNGERLFLKGSNQGPTRMALGEATEEELRRDVELATETGLDLLRVHGHVSRTELYDAADEAGLLLWQDFPLQWGYARGIRRQATRQAAAMVDLLGHHPSVAIWCGHNEPMRIDDTELPRSKRQLAALALRAAAAQQLPTWNKSVLDRSLKRALGAADPSRPVVAHSGVPPHPPLLDGTDSHLYFGWYWGDGRQFPGFCRVWPRMARFVSEFGAQAVPADARFCEPERWPELDWDRLSRRHSLQKELLDRRVPVADHDSFDSWREATQQYQATLIRHHVEHLRRLKYRPTGGFCQFCFADSHPAVTWSVLGHDRAPKAGFEALRAACRPVIVVADRPPAALDPGQAVALDVHVVSDLRHPLQRVEVAADLTWDGGRRSWRWRGDVPADAVVRVGHVQFVTPDVPGDVGLDLRCVYPGGATVNSYRSAIARHRD